MKKVQEKKAHEEANERQGEAVLSNRFSLPHACTPRSTPHLHMLLRECTQRQQLLSKCR